MPAYKNIARKPKPERVMREDGTFYTVKRNLFKWGFKMVDPDGWVHDNVPHASGCTITGWQGNEYGVFIREELKRLGFLRYTACPYEQGIRPLKGEEACDGGDDSGCCEHMERIIALRKAQKTEHSRQFEEQFETDAERKFKLQMKTFEGLMEQNKKATEGGGKSGFQGGGQAHRKGGK